MARTLKEATISTRKARSALKQGLHWRELNSGVHLGYRKGKRAGRWFARWYLGGGVYQQEGLAAADDAVDANGVDILTFEQAKSRAVAVVAERHQDAIAAAAGPVMTVADVVEAYMAERDRRDSSRRPGVKRGDARRRLTRHVMSAKVAAVPFFRLKKSDLSAWRQSLPDTLAGTTVKRLVNDFRAALNAAALAAHEAMPADLPLTIKVGLRVTAAAATVARDKQALANDEIRRVVEAARVVDAEERWDGDLLRMIVVLAATGARFGQVSRLCVGDVQVDRRRLAVPVSRKGRGDKAASHINVAVGADVIDALLPVLAGRRQGDPLLERWRHRQVPRSGDRPPHWVRDIRGPWLNASELTRPWLSILAKAELPPSTVPYSLRHSSIVRQLRAGLPVRLVARLHDTSSAMIERHYSAAIADALDDLADLAVVELITPAADYKVVRLRASNPQG